MKIKIFIIGILMIMFCGIIHVNACDEPQNNELIYILEQKGYDKTEVNEILEIIEETQKSNDDSEYVTIDEIGNSFAIAFILALLLVTAVSVIILLKTTK